MTSDVPPGRQCTMCDREAVDPTRPGALCEEHLAAIDDDQDTSDERDQDGADNELEDCSASHAARDGDADPERDDSEPPENRPPEGGSPAVEPGVNDDTNGSATPASATDSVDDVHEAFADAITWFHQQLDRALPDVVDHDTPRDYYRDARGWTDATINEKLLGWAPADEYALRDHLMYQGYSKETLLGTGLFYEDLTPHFQGRYVLPYFDESGRPVYAISRSIDADAGGHPGDWTGDQKYTKAIKTKAYSHVDEPIYGAETITEDTDRLLVAGGIADAITLHQAGYACISPVTTVRFKDKHEPRVVELVDQYDVDGVYMLNDAERPTVDKTELDGDETAARIRDALTIMQFGEGLRGAFGNAEFLTEEAIDPYFVDLPGGDDDLRKVDPDDFIHDGWGDVETLLAAARHASDHPGYQQWRDERKARAIQSAANTTTDTGDCDGESSALFDLSFTDVAPLSAGDRDDNPLGHHGDSHGYFVVVEQQGDVFGYDHKYDVAYNALTHLLCDAGERRADAPNGRLDDDEILAAWVHAKDRGLLDAADPIPRPALRAVARESTDWDGDLVEHETHAGDTFDGLPTDVYNAAIDAVRERHDVDPGREYADGTPEDYATDPTDLDATVDPRRAWDAAGQVTPGDLNDDRLKTAEDGGAFVCPACDDTVDVVRAVALDTGLISTCDAKLTDEYPEAYSRAREDYGAPLPAYYTTSDAVAEFGVVLDVISETTFWHLDTDALESEITERDGEVSGDAVRALNPAWRESDSEASVLVFDSGTVWDADTDRVLDAVRFVALDSGLIDDPGDNLAGERFTDAYQATRRDYGAPLPRWDPATDGTRDLTPMLPPSEEFVDAVDLNGVDGHALDEARDDVEALIREAASDAETPTVVTALPALGKTTSTVKTAADRPLSYLAPRKELQEQALAIAARWGVDAQVLPVFSEERVREDVLSAALSHVREVGKHRLRDRWAILDVAVGDAEEDLDPGDIFEDDEDGVSIGLERPTCETAEGDHGVAWALAVHVARRLGYTPQEIHTQARGLFGAPLPCSCDDHADESDMCTYTEGWESVRDPDDPTDLLVGSYVHGHVESVRTHYDRDPSGDIQRTPRALVLDEFVGEAYTREFGDEAIDFATWLASALREDVADRRDMYRAELWGDDWVRAWVEGDAGDHPEVQDTVAVLARHGDLLDARDAAQEIRAEVDTGLLETLGLSDPLDAVDGDALAAFDELQSALSAVDPTHPAAGVARWVRDDVRDPLAQATLEGRAEPSIDAVDTTDTPISGDLAALVEDAVDAVEDTRDSARERLRAAVTALSGGREGCRRLAAWASDGYAHPDAHHLLRGVATPTDAGSDVDGAHRIETDAWAFDPDATDGTVVDVVETSERGRVVLDRNDHGALLHTPPARVAGNGDKCPLVGLDATGRAPLWSTALGEDVVTEDIHDTPAERAEFLETALSLRVIQAADRPRSYEGDPSAKDTDGDVALLQALADEYSGLEAPRQRGEDAVKVGRPAAITTKQVRDLLEADDRLDGVVAAWDNYGNVTGTNDLGDHQLGAILGSQHYGDHAIERFCALAGEEADTSRAAGRGAALNYGNNLANEYLAHMSEDQTMQAILRFARGDSGATVVARTSALRDDLPIVGRAQVAETWNDTATTIARAYRRLGAEFTSAEVRDLVDVGPRQVRRVLAELDDAGYLRCVDDSGRAKRYVPVEQPGAGEVELPKRGTIVEDVVATGHSATNQYYTWNVRVTGGDGDTPPLLDPPNPPARGSPPAPTAVAGPDRPPDAAD